MSYYETMYIAHPALEGGRLKDLVTSIESSMSNLGGKTCAIDIWGKKKLAYPINKEKYGIYILFQFENDGSNNKEFNLELEHNPNVLAYLTTKIDNNKILADLDSLDVQLGLSTKNETDYSSEAEEPSESNEVDSESDSNGSDEAEEPSESNEADDSNKEEK